MADKKAKTTPKKEVKASVESTEKIDSSTDTVEAPEKEVKKEESPETEVKGNENPATGKAHDCISDGRVRSINVGGRRKTECIVCGNRF